MKLKDEDKLKVLNFIRDCYINQKSCKIYKHKAVVGHTVEVLTDENDYKELQKKVKLSAQMIEQCLNEFCRFGYLAKDMTGCLRLTEKGESFYQTLHERSEINKRDIRSAVIAFVTTVITSPFMIWLIDWLKK